MLRVNTDIALTRGIEVRALTDAERRLLLEMLASERCGEDALNVVDHGRDGTADALCELEMSQWVSFDCVVFTRYGRTVAETLAYHLFHRHSGLQS